MTEFPRGVKIVPIECDMSSRSSLETAASRVAKETGYINLVIAHTEIMRNGQGSLAPPSQKDTRDPLTVQDVHKVF